MNVCNIANFVTFLRVVLALFVFLFLFLGERYIALGFLAAAVFTDFLDGIVARSRKETSNFGKLFDPTTDKFLILGCLFILLCLDKNKGSFMPVLVILISSRELTVMIYRIAACVTHWDEFKNNISLPDFSRSLTPNYHGKIKMILESFSVSFLILGFKTFGTTLLFFAAVFAYISFFKIIWGVDFEK